MAHCTLTVVQLEQGLATSQTMLLLPDRWTAWQAQVIGFDLIDCEGGINEPALFSGVDASRFASVTRVRSCDRKVGAQIMKLI